MSDAFIGQLADALAIELDAAEPTSTRHTAALMLRQGLHGSTSMLVPSRSRLFLKENA
jgi:hypothetical protein